MPHRYLTRHIKRFFIYRVLHVDDTPHRIALGVAIGIFITWTPTIGLQMALVVAIAALLRANKIVGVPFVWISNPVTLVPIYGPNHWLGTKILGGNYDFDQLRPFVEAVATGGNWFERLHAAWDAMWRVFWPLWLGSAVVGGVLAVITYFVIRYAVVRYRRFWHEKHPRPPWADDKAETDPKTPGPKPSQQTED
jgi:uncharacterized protein